MSLRSFTPQETRDQVNELMETLGGYVQSSRGDRFSYRIPSDRLDEAVEGLRQIGEVVDENLRSEDVTMEVATLSAQIAETEESRQRIMAMLEQTNAVSENLAIEDELRTVTQELESHQGRARYLNKRLQMSPLEVVVSMKVRPKVEEPRKSQPFPWVEGYGLSGLLD